MNTINNAKETTRIQLKLHAGAAAVHHLYAVASHTHISVRADFAFKLVTDEWGHLTGRASALETKNNMKTKQAGIF